MLKNPIEERWKWIDRPKKGSVESTLLGSAGFHRRKLPVEKRAERFAGGTLECGGGSAGGEVVGDSGSWAVHELISESEKTLFLILGSKNLVIANQLESNFVEWFQHYSIKAFSCKRKRGWSPAFGKQAPVFLLPLKGIVFGRLVFPHQARKSSFGSALAQSFSFKTNSFEHPWAQSWSNLQLLTNWFIYTTFSSKLHLEAKTKNDSLEPLT